MGRRDDKITGFQNIERIRDLIMRKYTERLDIKMTSQDMLLLAAASLKANQPLTVYARNLILNQINPMMQANKEGRVNARLEMENSEPYRLEE